MASKIISTSTFVGMKVKGGKKGTQRIGKVHTCVFHPSAKRCIGFLIKRPDLLLMFHRPDSFVSLDGFDLEQDAIYLHDEKGTRGEAACKKLGIDWDECVIWEGLVVCAADGTPIGRVGSVSFDLTTGNVDSIEIEEGLATGALLGKREIPAAMILGFKRGAVNQLTVYHEPAEASDEEETETNAEKRKKALMAEAAEIGALLVSAEAKEIQNSGGIAEKAGKATAVAGAKVKKSVDDVVDSAKPVVSKATKTAGKAVNKGAYATGKQISRAKGMFGAFRDEFNKAKK